MQPIAPCGRSLGWARNFRHRRAGARERNGRDRRAVAGDRCFGGADGLVTNQPGVSLGIYVADCGAVFLVDPVRRCLGLVHSGKKGTELAIVERAIEQMRGKFRQRRRAIWSCSSAPAFARRITRSISRPRSCGRRAPRAWSRCTMRSAAPPATWRATIPTGRKRRAPAGCSPSSRCVRLNLRLTLRSLRPVTVGPMKRWQFSRPAHARRGLPWPQPGHDCFRARRTENSRRAVQAQQAIINKGALSQQIGTNLLREMAAVAQSDEKMRATAAGKRLQPHRRNPPPHPAP